MKITEIDVEKIRIPLKEPFHVAFGDIEYGESMIIKVVTDEGISGYGEAAPIEYVTGETIDTVYEVLKLFRKKLVGDDPAAIDRLHERMDRIIAGNTSAKCAVDLALYDIMGKKANMPVYKLLGGYSGTIRNDATISLDNTEKMVADAEKCVKNGYKIIKIKAGLDAEEDIRNIRAIREAVGMDIRLRVDANQGYDVPSAHKALKAFSECGVETAEQCLPAWDLEGAAWLKNKGFAGISLMLDESVHTPADAARAAKMRAADMFNIKLMKCGGLYRAEQIYAIAAANGLGCIIGCMMESRLANTAGLSIAAAKQGITDADCDSYTMYRSDLITGGFTADQDQITLWEKPGFGLKIDF